MAGNTTPRTYLVMHLNRWERTKLALTWRERFACLITGAISLEGFAEADSIGWLPMFDSEIAADSYRLRFAPTAQILPMEGQP